MKITKYTHACLLVQTDNATALFDPGNFSHDTGLFDVAILQKLDYLIITHEHQDHFYLPLVISICKQFPRVKVVTTAGVANQLVNHVEVEVHTIDIGLCKLFKSPHEELPLGSAPDNIGVHFGDFMTHPGDSHSFNETREVLAMPMTAPWGSMTAAVHKIKELKPRIVIPIHDWHWRPEALTGMYKRIQQELALSNIDFIIPVDGQDVSL